MVAELQVKAIQWGKVVFCLDNEVFRKGFEEGRKYYFDDINGTNPQCATMLLATEDVLCQIVALDTRTGRYHFDDEGLEHLEEYLGVLLGYMSGPLTISAIVEE